MNHPPTTPRRHFLRHTATYAVAGVVPGLATPARAALGGSRDLAMAHTHTREQLDLVYALHDRYVPESLGLLNRFLRDHYSGEVGTMDPQLFDLLHRVRQLLGSTAAFQIISGYRAPATNQHLRLTRGGGVASKSLHTEGRAIDVRLPGVALTDLRDAAL
jgi:uncharacterized protein YcbK (DUF882 family)